MTFTWSHNLALSVAAMSGVWLAVLMFYDVPKARRWTTGHEMFFRFDRRALGRLAMLGLPLGWVATLTSLGVNTPRYFLEYYCGLEEQGIYSSLAYLFVVVSLVVVALTQSVTTRLARLFADGDRKEFVLLLSKLSLLGMLVAVAGVPLMLLFGPPLLTLLYRSEYAEHTGLAALLMGTAGALDGGGVFIVRADSRAEVSRSGSERHRSNGHRWSGFGRSGSTLRPGRRWNGAASLGLGAGAGKLVGLASRRHRGVADVTLARSDD